MLLTIRSSLHSSQALKTVLGRFLMLLALGIKNCNYNMDTQYSFNLYKKCQNMLQCMV